MDSPEFLHLADEFFAQSKAFKRSHENVVLVMIALEWFVNVKSKEIKPEDDYVYCPEEKEWNGEVHFDEQQWKECSKTEKAEWIKIWVNEAKNKK